MIGGDALPEPVCSRHVTLLAESILRSANSGERDAVALQRIALLELADSAARVKSWADEIGNEWGCKAR